MRVKSIFTKKINYIFLVAIFLLSCSYHYNISLKRLLNKKLTLLAIKDKNLSLASGAYLILKDDKSFRAFSGCNDFKGKYKLTKDYIHFSIDDIDTKVCKYIYIQHDFLEKLVNSKNITFDKKRVYFKDLNNNTLLIFKEK